MPNESLWFDSFTTLDLQTDEGTPTSTPVAGIQNVGIVPSVSNEQLYTADSIKIAVQKQHEFSVDVTIGYSEWDETVARQWLGGSGNAAASSMTDTSDPQKYELDADFVGASGNTLSAKVNGITFESMPIIDAARGEFVQWDLEGVGEDILEVDKK